MLRRVIGSSMVPALRPGQLVIARSLFLKLKPQDIVVVHHASMEKIKRISQVTDSMIYVLGDNPGASTDSRDFGWLPKSSVIAKLVWPH